MNQPKCPECGSTDVEQEDPETGFCNESEFYGDASRFVEPLPKGKRK